MSYNNEAIPEEKSKPNVKYTYYNPNTFEKTRELLKNVIVKILIDKKIDLNSDDSRN